MRYFVSLESTLKHTFLFSFLLLAGCVTASSSGSSDISKINIVDQSVQMRPLSNTIMRAGYIFPAVQSHEIEYKFNCGRTAYNLTFVVDNRDDELDVSLKHFSPNSKDLKVNILTVINEWLAPFQTVGPVGLKCSSDKPDMGLSLIIRGARVNEDTGIYDFKNKSFILQQGDFE